MTPSSGLSDPSFAAPEAVRPWWRRFSFAGRRAAEAALTACHDEVARREAELARYRAALAEFESVCAAAARGDLEPRLACVDDDTDLGRAARSINHLLDQTDAYVRESTAVLQAASDGRFYRRFLRRGLHGSLGAGAGAIDGACAD